MPNYKSNLNVDSVDGISLGGITMNGMYITIIIFIVANQKHSHSVHQLDQIQYAHDTSVNATTSSTRHERCLPAKQGLKNIDYTWYRHYYIIYWLETYQTLPSRAWLRLSAHLTTSLTILVRQWWKTSGRPQRMIRTEWKEGSWLYIDVCWIYMQGYLWVCICLSANQINITHTQTHTQNHTCW